MHDDLMCLPSLHYGKQHKLSWKSPGIILSDFCGNPAGSVMAILYSLNTLLLDFVYPPKSHSILKHSPVNVLHFLAKVDTTLMYAIVLMRH